MIAAAVKDLVIEAMRNTVLAVGSGSGSWAHAPGAAPPAATAVLAGASALQAETGLLARLRPATSGRFGPYEILGEISRGGMGVVYKARQTGLGRVVALKVIIAGQASSEAVERFRREARALSSLRHPNIVGVHEVGEIEGVNYFSMDFIEGLTIDHAVTQEMLSPRDVAEIFVKICEAAGYAHSKGVVHRDLKPRNIILDKRREPVLIDFGIARVTEIEREAGALTRKDEVLGSPAYLAPEYLSGAVPRYDEACDVYSLGACLYHALSGRSPHADVDTIKIILSASTRDAPHIRQFARSIDRDLATIVMTAVDRQRQHRYRSARDMAHDLRRYLDGETVAARATPVVRWWRRVRLKVAATLGLILSFALVGMSGYYASKFRALEKTEATTGVAEVALRRRMVELAMKLAEAQLAGGHAQDAEHTATEAIALAAGPNLAPAYCLRAKVRRALGHAEQADEDDKLAATAPTK